MRGLSLNVHVNSPSYEGPTVPTWIKQLDKYEPEASKLTKFIDVSAVYVADAKEIRVAIVNRHDTEDFTVPFVFAREADIEGQVRVHEVWGEQLGFSNGFDSEKVKTVERMIVWEGQYLLKKHSFQGKTFGVIPWYKMSDVVDSSGIQAEIDYGYATPVS